jgi:hypothetical protein
MRPPATGAKHCLVDVPRSLENFQGDLGVPDVVEVGFGTVPGLRRGLGREVRLMGSELSW